MNGKTVKRLRNALAESIILGGPVISLKRVKRNHQGSRKAFSKPANVTTGFHCCRPAAVAGKSMIAAKFDRWSEK